MSSSSRAPSWLRRFAPLLGGFTLSLAVQLSAHAADLRVGFMPGPYRDAFTNGIEPQLKKLGYTVKYVEFSQGVQPNDAVERGQIDADLGAGLIKQRVARPGAGKSGGFRTLVFFRAETRAVFAFGFAKSDMANLDDAEEAYLKKAAKLVLGFADAQMDAEVAAGRMFEVNCDEQDLQE